MQDVEQVNWDAVYLPAKTKVHCLLYKQFKKKIKDEKYYILFSLVNCLLLYQRKKVFSTFNSVLQIQCKMFIFVKSFLTVTFYRIVKSYKNKNVLLEFPQNKVTLFLKFVNSKSKSFSFIYTVSENLLISFSFGWS